MMSIKEDYVNFNTAKLMKEKGFDIPCRQYLTLDGRLWFCLGSDLTDGSADWNSTSMGYTSVPTLQMAMKWLREVHNCIIMIDYDSYESTDDSSITETGYSFTLQRKEKPTEYEYIHNWVYNTYEEAVEEAIKYALTHKFFES